MKRYCEMKNARVSSLLLLMSLVAIALVPGTALAQDPREETRLRIAAPEDVPLGNMARIIATLQDAQGNPIPDVPIVFTSPASFAGTVAEMDLGEVWTNAEGVALLDYGLRMEGQNQFIARFDGNDSYRPVEASATVSATGTAQLSQRSAGVEVPFLGAWTLVLVLIGVWSVYLVAMLLVSQIPDAGERQR
jgi:hypothetical protein